MALKMIPKSIKWRLQIWYGLILVVVLAGFGVMAYQLERGRQIRRVDDELHRRFLVLIKVLRPGPPQLERPPQDRPPQDWQPRDDRQSRDRNLDNRPREQTPDDFFPPPEGQNLESFTLPVYAASLFDTNQPDEFYFVIHSRNHQEIARGGDVPGGLDANFIPASQTNRLPGPDNSKPPSAWTQDGFREIFEATPAGTEVRVGCSLQPEFRELRLTALHLASVGGLILLVGLAGGWWLVGRALQPISEISATATKIAAGDLSQRINSAETESELGRLAAVLNSTFARLETAFAQQKQFASDAAHELRTPVTVILTQTQLALGRDRDAAGYKQTVEACQRAAQRMRKLIESLLELARFDAGQEVLNRWRLDFAETVAECVELVQPLAEARRITITSELAPLEIKGDPERLAQVVTNLLTNAIQYNQPEGRVRVKLAQRDGLGVLEISNTGRGIAAADLPRVFERFYRGDKSRADGGHAGLGLSICKVIVEAHGGTVEAASMSDAGATFTVRLPMKT